MNLYFHINSSKHGKITKKEAKLNAEKCTKIHPLILISISITRKCNKQNSLT